MARNKVTKVTIATEFDLNVAQSYKILHFEISNFMVHELTLTACKIEEALSYHFSEEKNRVFYKRINSDFFHTSGYLDP